MAEGPPFTRSERAPLGEPKKLFDFFFFFANLYDRKAT